MQGYLYVQQSRGLNQPSSFTSRYFISFPFCGLKWFREEPTGESMQQLFVDNTVGGWVFGGDVLVLSFAIEAPTVRKEVLESYVYPFSIELARGDDKKILVRLASEEEDVRSLWIQEIQKMMQVQNYLFSCKECGGTPSSIVFNAYSIPRRSLILNGMRLNTNTLGSIVMSSKLNEPDGSVLQKLSLENAQLADRHIPLLCSLLSFCPFLSYISLQDNYITCTGLIELSNSLTLCPELQNLNFSSNFIADKGTLSLCEALAALQRLKSFDISRNRLSEKVAKPLALYLARHDSELEHINFAYNPMGDPLGSLVALLLTNQPSRLVSADLSYCSIRDVGLNEIALAIPFCATLKTLKLNGNFAEGKVTSKLVGAISSHYEKFGRFQVLDYSNINSVFGVGTGLIDKGSKRNRRRALKQNLTLSIGGMSIVDNELQAMSKPVFKGSMILLGDFSVVGNAVLRRRVYLHKQDMTDLAHSIRSTSTMKQRLAQMAAARQGSNANINSNFICTNGIACVRIRLSTQLSSVYDALNEIARVVGAHPSQLILISATVSAEPNICFVLLTPINPTPNMLKSKQRMNALAKAGSRAYHSYRQSNRKASKPISSPEPVDINTLLPSAFLIMQRFQDLCRISDAKIRKIGITSVFLYIPVSGSGATANQENSAKYTAVSFHVSSGNSIAASTRQVSSVSAEVYDFLPSLYPVMSYIDEDVGSGSMSEDEEGRYDDQTGRVRRRSRSRRSSRSPLRHGKSSKSASFRVDSDIFGEYLEDEDEGIEHRVGHSRMDTFDDVYGIDTDDVQVDADIGAIVEKAVLKDLDVRMVSAIAASYEEAGALDSDSAHFWEGVFGVPKWLKYTEAVIMAPIQEEGMFKAVAMRKKLCDAMFKRDVVELGNLTEKIKTLNIPGGHALLLAESFLADLLTLKHSSEALRSLAQGPDDIQVIEKFLLSCARLGYAGPETLAAIELREFLVRWALNENPAAFESDLVFIRKRSMLTNMMITRNVKDLRANVSILEAAPNNELTPVILEVKAAKVILEDEIKCSEKLKLAIESRSLETVEEAIAEAAYHNLFNEDTLRYAINIMLELGADSRGVFIKVNNAIREGKCDVLDAVSSEIRRVGWSHSAVSAPVLTRILGLRNKILQEEITKARIIKVADAVSALGSVANPGEVMQLLRRVRLLKLDSDPTLRGSLSLLQEKMRHITVAQHQEEAILKLLEEKNVVKLSELLSGRGQGRLVMAASSPEVMNDWFDALKSVCALHQGISTGIGHRGTSDNQAREDVSTVVIKAGPLEKAARGTEGVLRNWRLRYFVLQGHDLTYFTKLGGEKKGTIRVTGGAVRLLSPSEASGHHNCIELQEGRDLSMIDPELLDEVRKQVNIFRRDQLEEELSKAIAVGSEERLAAAIETAHSHSIVLDIELMAQARAVLSRQQHKKLKCDLRDAMRTLPRRRLQELIRTAKRVRLDPNNGLLRSVLVLVDKSDVELTLLRSRAQMFIVDDAVFKRSISTVQQLDSKRLTVREKYLLVAILLQWTGYTILRNIVQGNSTVAHSVHILDQVLASIMIYYVETEPMQLARTILEGLKASNSEDDDVFVGRDENRSQLQKQQQSLSHLYEATSQFQNTNTTTTYSLERFPQLKRGDSTDVKKSGGKTGGGLLGFLGKSKRNVSENESSGASGDHAPVVPLVFTMDSISRPMSHISKTYESSIQEVFEGLQVVMLDRPLAQFSGTQNRRGSFFSRLDISSIACDLVSCGVANVDLRDELYLHICKQTKNNPKAVSRYYGWSMFSVYLNCFPPSFGLLPYLKSYVTESLVFENKLIKDAEVGGIHRSVSRRRFSVNRTVTKDESSDIVAGTPKLISYCSRLLQNIEQRYTRGAELVVFKPERKILSDLFTSASLEFEIVVMTGSVYRLSLTPTEIDSPISALYSLFKQLVSGIGTSSLSDYGGYFSLSDAAIAENKKNAPISTSESAMSADNINSSVTDFLLKTFRGFGLYRLQGDEGFEGALIMQRQKSLNDSKIFADVEDGDMPPIPPIEPATTEPAMWSNYLSSFPVQPPEANFIDWGEDLLWDLLVSGSAVVVASESRDENDSPVQNTRKSFIANYNTVSPQSPSAYSATSNNSIRKRYVLRKRVALCTEVFAGQFELFGEEASDRDIVSAKKLWSAWLVPPSSNNASQQLLPSDHIRVDMLFAEETRFVNSKKYIYSTASQVYLNALQLVLSCYSDTISENHISGRSWGSGQSFVMQNSNLSVRPCLPSNSLTGNAAKNTLDGVSDSNPTSAVLSPSRRASASTRRISFDTPGNNNEESYSPTPRGSENGYLGDFKSLTRPITLDNITDSDKAALLELCRETGITVDDDEFLHLVEWIGHFQNVALTAGTSILSPRFRYMIKRAYLGYLCAFPLYGSHFFEAMLLGSYTVTVNANKIKSSSTMEIAEEPVSATGSNPKELKNVSIAVNGEGIHVIAADSWESIFIAPLFDIISMTVLPPVRQNDVFATSEELDVRFTYPMFSMNVNGIEVQFLSKSTGEIKKLVESFCMEALARGSFPHGTEGGNDIYELGTSFIPSSDPKERINRFLSDFPLLPNPPPPPVLIKSSEYFAPPLSRRAILAEERAAEERRELELSKRAAESHLAKHLAKLETGREALSRFLSEDDEEDDDEAHELSDSLPTKENRGVRERSRAAREDVERVRQARIASALCGVSARHSNVIMDIIEPFSSRGGLLTSGDHYEKGRFHPPPLLMDKISASDKDLSGSGTDVEDTSSPRTMISHNWPSDVKLIPVPKTLTNRTAVRDDSDWPSSTTIYLKNEDAKNAEVENAMQWIAGMHYEHSEYMSRSMIVVADAEEAVNVFEEGAAPTAISLSTPVSVSTNRRGSMNSYSVLMRRNSTGASAALTAEDDGSSPLEVLPVSQKTDYDDVDAEEANSDVDEKERRRGSFTQQSKRTSFIDNSKRSSFISDGGKSFDSFALAVENDKESDDI